MTRVFLATTRATIAACALLSSPAIAAQATETVPLAAYAPNFTGVTIPSGQTAAWSHLHINAMGDLLEQLVPGSSVIGGTAPASAFATGQPLAVSGSTFASPSSGSDGSPIQVGTTAANIGSPGTYKSATIQAQGAPICFSWNTSQTLSAPAATGACAGGGLYLAAGQAFTLTSGAIPTSQLRAISAGGATVVAMLLP